MEYEYILKTCLNCGEKTFNDENTKYCINCGDKLFNYCSNKECFIDGEIPPLPTTAKYCPYCGAGTSLYDYALSEKFTECVNNKDLKKDENFETLESLEENKNEQVQVPAFFKKKV